MDRGLFLEKYIYTNIFQSVFTCIEFTNINKSSYYTSTKVVQQCSFKNYVVLHVDKFTCCRKSALRRAGDAIPVRLGEARRSTSDKSEITCMFWKGL